MRVEDIHRLFNFTFEKSSKDIVAAANRKTEALLAKIGEREERVRRIRAEYRITDAALIDILTQARAALQRNDALAMNYSAKNSSIPSQPGGAEADETITIGAGVVNHLLTEQDYIEGERAQVTRLGFMIRNLQDLPTGFEGAIRGHKLSYDELQFLGF